MGNVERCDKTLPLNEMIFYVRRDAALRAHDEKLIGHYREMYNLLRLPWAGTTAAPG